MRTWVRVGLLAWVTGTLLAGCWGNPYMLGGSDEYLRLQENLAGQWKISSYTVKGKELIGTSFKAARVVFEGIEEGRAQGNAKFVFTVRDELVKERAMEWKQKLADFKIKRYDVVVNAHWLLNRSGDVLYIRDALALPEIEGTGQDIPEVSAWEHRLFAASTLSDDGPAAGLAAIFPALPAHGRLQMAPSELKLAGARKIHFSMQR